jgi:hypothetical protein
MPNVKTIAIAAAVTLATIYLYNRFSDPKAGGVANLGR